MPTRILAIWIFAMSSAAWASYAFANDDSVETIVITGSRLSRMDGESASPIVVVPSQMFLQSSAVSVERTLNEMPQFVPVATGTSNAPSNDGQANISLRGLSPSQTLVLLDGRRLMPSDGRGSVDLNVLPPALVDRVDVISGGASAVYGSDAIAGVVNFRLNDRFEGFRVDGGWSETSRGDGSEYSTGLTAGTTFANERGSIMGYVGYTKRDQIGQSDRNFSRYPLQYYADEYDGLGPGGHFLGLGQVPVEGQAIVFASPQVFQNVFASYGLAPGTVPYIPAFIVNQDGSVFTIGNGAAGSVANYRGATDAVTYSDREYNGYNPAPYTALQMPLDRKSVFSSAKFEFSERFEGYAQVLAANYTVDRQLAPTVVGIALVPPTNPHIPADLATLAASRANPAAPFRYFRRLDEAGASVAENERDLVQLTTGVRGQLSASWSFDGYVQFGRNDRTEQQAGNVVLSRFQDLTFAADGGASICGSDFNPFTATPLSSECIEYVTTDASNKVTIDQNIAEISVNGPLLELPAGPLRAAFGVFYKKDQFDYNADPVLSAMLPGVTGVIGPRADIAGFDAAPDRSGEENNTDLYVELLVPLLDRMPWAQSLDLGVGYRYADYQNAGGVGSYKADVAYRPVDAIRLRGSYQHTVRAPSVEELFYPHVAGQFVVNPPDPCSASSRQRNGPDRAQVETLCLTQGLPPALLPGFQYPLARVDGISGGNPDLDPEQADTYTFGVVLASSLEAYELGDWQLSIDWYRIDIEDGIGRWQADSAIDRCFDPAFNPTYAPQNIYCTFFERNRDTGQIFALITDRNIGGVRTSGVDLQVDWGVNAGPGRVSVNENLTWVDEWQYRDPSGGVIEYAGTIGGGGLGRSLPEWKSLLNVSYQWNRARLFAKWQYIDAQNDVQYRDFKVPARNYFGLSASYEVDAGRYDGLTARFGVENLFDEAPPVFPTWQQANTDPSQYDVLGRRYFFSVSYRV